MARRATRNAQLFPTLNLSAIQYRGLLRSPRSFVYVRYNIQRYGHSTTHRCLSAGKAVAGGGTRCRAITIGGLRLKEKY